MKKTKWGLIGCGKVVLKNPKTPFINKNNTITAICTTSMQSAEMAKKKLKIKNCSCYTNVDKMIKNNNLDCIYIATPPKFHYLYLKKLYKYNIPIYVEKPFVRSYKEAEEIRHLYKNNDFVFIAHYKRITKQVKKIKNIIKSQKIGNIISIDGNFERIFNKSLYYNSWIYNTEISGGGRFIDIAPHILDTLYYLFGEMEILNSSVKYNKKYNTEKMVIANIRFNKFNCHLKFNFESKNDIDELIIYGEKGKIITSINRNPDIYIEYNNGKKKKFHIKNNKIWGIEAIKEINRLINNKKSKEKICDINEACIIQKYINLIMKNENKH